MKLERTIEELIQKLSDKNLTKNEREDLEQQLDEYRLMLKERQNAEV